MLKIRTGGVAAVVLAAVSCAHAQDAVQWRVEDGGNGHWYALVSSEGVPDWESMIVICAELGGHLADLTSMEESVFVAESLVQSVPSRGALFGARSMDPASGDWEWATGEPWEFTNWYGGSTKGEEMFAYLLDAEQGYPAGKWDDTDWGYQYQRAVVEWSADCNGDGIVDYGQILDGTYADEDGNGVPDCCEGACPGDLNLDDRVDSADLGLLIAAWNTDGSIVAGSDINGDGIVNAADLGLQIGNWGECGGCD